jgi:anhydro-N-acetylmuramic acid kinase
VPADAKEALLFAVLANETLSSNALSLGNTPAVCMGKISLPL